MMRRPQWPKWVGNGSPRFRRALATDELPRSARNGHCERTPQNGHSVLGYNRRARLQGSRSPAGSRYRGSSASGGLAACLDYDTPEGVRKVKVRAANAGYMLRR